MKTYLFPITIGLGGLVILHKFIVHELQCEGGFANATAAHHDDLVQRWAGSWFLTHDFWDLFLIVCCTRRAQGCVGEERERAGTGAGGKGRSLNGSIGRLALALAHTHAHTQNALSLSVSVSVYLLPLPLWKLVNSVK